MITEGLKCARCMHDLVVLESYNFWGDEYGMTTILQCPHCGASYECTEPNDEDKMEYQFYQNNQPTDGRLQEEDIMNEHCLNCGEKIFVTGNNMLSDFDETVKDDDDDAMSYNMCTCPNCGMIEVRWDTPENDKKNYPYWSEEEKESTED